jgi:hypothetical protein
MASTTVTDTIKSWIHPGLMYLLGTIICYEVSQTQGDVKLLLAQSNVDKTEISHLKEEVSELKQIVFFSKHPEIKATINYRKDISLVDRYFKHEEEFDVKQHINRI